MARRKKAEEHENLERWLVSYADFITLLFAFFVVMYAISSINEGKYRVLSDSLVNAFRNTPSSADAIVIRQDASRAPVGSSSIVPPIQVRKTDSAQEAKRKSQQERMKNVAKDILTVLNPLVKEGHVRVTQTTKGVVVEINASVLFSLGQANLQPESTKALRAVALVLAGTDFPIQVEGHTDITPISTAQFPSNWELSAARASSVVRLFVENGVATDRLVAVGYGEFHPVESNLTPEGRARNRRVAVMIHGEKLEKLTDLPITSSVQQGP